MERFSADYFDGRSSGRRAVEVVVHAGTAVVRGEGAELECSSCHLDQKTFGLRPNAVDDLARWL